MDRNNVSEYIQRNEEILSSDKYDADEHIYEVIRTWNEVFIAIMDIDELNDLISEVSSDESGTYSEVNGLIKAKVKAEGGIISLLYSIFSGINNLPSHEKID